MRAKQRGRAVTLSSQTLFFEAHAAHTASVSFSLAPDPPNLALLLPCFYKPGDSPVSCNPLWFLKMQLHFHLP